jgi:hypothetical protein
MNLLNMLYSKIVAHFRHLLNGCNDTFVFSLTGLEDKYWQAVWWSRNPKNTITEVSDIFVV